MMMKKKFITIHNELRKELDLFKDFTLEAVEEGIYDDAYNIMSEEGTLEDTDIKIFHRTFIKDCAGVYYDT